MYVPFIKHLILWLIEKVKWERVWGLGGGGDEKMLPGDHFQFRKRRAGAAGPHRWPRIWIRSAVPSDNRPANLMLALQTPFESLCLQLSMQKKKVYWN